MALIAGSLLALVMIISMRLMKTENTVWAYPVCLLSLPALYIGFALYGHDMVALQWELIIALPFLLAAMLCSIKGLTYSAYIMAAAWLLHGVYDVLHGQLFNNAGVPLWWPAFCGAVDIIIGLYLIALARQSPKRALLPHAAENAMPV